ncbi:MAG TPA: DNA repair protein RadA, partial [Ruminococcaceae bacterium]|nr:DNA repair protein RadA [Oscillospiraceae bacterium]
MAGKVKTKYVCNSCGYKTSQWMGRCAQCGEWNSFSEEVEEPVISKVKAPTGGSGVPLKSDVVSLNEISTDDEVRFKTGMSELDRVLGGGIVKGSLVLLGGDPGIGKSTLLLQICDYLCRGLKVMYFSGEESVRQIKLRAQRLDISTENLYVISTNSMDNISHTILTYQPDIAIVDSIQTVSLSALSSSPGSITQVRECTQELMRIAKYNNISVLVIGHVNKDGAIAGPKVLEHIVDTVLYFEGERNFSYRVLRAVKNRFGSTNEIGMFEMQTKGLAQVENPSAYLLEERPKNTSGSCVACIIEGSRPILSEIQALVTK